ncbi:ABC transporter permease [Acidicapsa ligni]|uniref:ABC transporter permease n=1 Tax=Acidicapsa ligni TaxID=542300 RepID=UPI0021E02CA2|nr:ABC transporter permease [Acidicapsa ligni]
MRNIVLIAKREYLEQIRSRTFRITTVLVPGLFALAIFVGFISGEISGNDKHVVVASADTTLATEIRKQLLEDKDSKSTVDIYAPIAAGELTANDKAALIHQVDEKQIDGFLWVDTHADASPKAIYDAQSSGDFITANRLESALNHALIRRRITQRGVPEADVESLMKKVDIDTAQIKNGVEVKSNALSSIYTAYAMAFLLTMTTMVYGLNVGRSVIQEKTSRIFEVMLATVKPSEMLAGKLIGVGTVGLTQIAIWMVTASIFAATALGERLLTVDLAIHISWIQIVLFAVYFLLGYAFNSALFAGLGATLETEQELQQYSPLAAVPVWLSFSMIMLISTNPSSKWVLLVSLFPPCTPIVMFLRMGSQMPPAWQIWLSIGLMLAAVLAVIWFATRLYRIGILMYGKRATIPEILRWLRYS